MIGLIAGIAAVASVVVLALVAPGYEAQEVPRLDASVWVMRESGQYARVNTDLAEIDTVRNVDAPEAIWQDGSDAVLYSQGSRQRWDLDPTAPTDLMADTAQTGTPSESEPTPSGTREIVSAGASVAYLTDTGQVSVSTLAPGAATSLVDPFAQTEVADGDEPPSYAADAIGLSPEGILAMYSADEQAVRRFDIAEHRFLGDGEAVADAPEADDDLTLTVVGDRWAMLSAASGDLWLPDADAPLALDVSDDAKLQRGAAAGDELLIADNAGLIAVPFDTGEPRRIVEARGVPAAPLALGAETFAAWLDTDGGTLWSGGDTVALTVPDDALESARIAPVFRDNGDRAVLNESSTGLVWTAPAGVLIPLEQWAVEDETEEREGTIVVEDIAEQLPPVAVDDAFGVRPGAQVVLPVLYNDHDPNKKDVLTVVPDSVADAGGGFLSDLAVVDDGQSLVATVAATSGQTTFTYSVTDGVDVSPPATVTLSVAADDQNSAPEWCGVESCRQEWPTPQLLPGGSSIVPALSGWVDPEGDPFILSDAYEADSGAPIMVVPMADGRVALHHTDPNAADATIDVTLQVTDSRGATAEKTLQVRVTGSAALQAAPVALTARVGDPQTVHVGDHLTGGSGSYRLLDATQTAATAEGLEVSPNTAAGDVELTVAEPGEYVITYTAQDTVTQAEQTAIIRVTAVDGASPLAMSPLTAFVREGEDTTVDVLSAVQNTTGRVLLLSGALSSAPELSASVVGNELLRVSGTTSDGAPGLVGTVTVSVADGAGAAVDGTVSVFLAPPSTVTRPIVFPDAVTVRAGSLTRIGVAANDVAPRGEALVVLPEVTGSGEDGELVFADGRALRYLAPTTPGTYRLSYSVSLERNPALSDTGSVVVTVVPAGTNRPPTPTSLTGRVLSGQRVSIPVPSTGVDADGDRVVLHGVDQPGAGKGTVTISPGGGSIVYRAPEGGVEGGQVAFDYTVRDPSGDTGTARVRIGVLDRDVDDAAPITFSDYVRVGAGADTPVVLDPRANDLDPTQGDLELIDLVPNAPAAPGNPLYARLDALIDPSTSLDDGRVVLRAGETPGTNSYIYTVRSTRTASTAQGLIVFSVADGAVADHPVVADTVLTARDRADLAETGIDVITDRVSWPSGDVSALRLSLWGDQPGFEVEGNRIVGEAPREGALVPFRVSGVGADGEDAIGYGFLQIPAFDDMTIQLAADVAPVLVDEDTAESFSVRGYLDLPPSEAVQIGSGDFLVQRAAATCTASGTGQAIYTAGREAPWSDTCLVPVRLDGQKRWSYVEVPISIRPSAPELLLSPISHTVAPGASTSVDLYDGMASWQGGREGDRNAIDYRVVYEGSAFIVTQKGATLRVEARADARPGTRENVIVTASGFGEPSAAVRLVVGAAPVDAPRGAALTRQCVVTDRDCTVEVVGVAGEYDPFQGKEGAGLTLKSLGAGARCDVASATVTGTTAIRVSWPSGGRAPGGQCTIPFVVADAQGRTGNGTLTLDLQGFPQPPSSVTTVGYSASTVVLEVPLGEAGRAHPRVSSVSIQQDGAPASASCTPSGGVYRCTVSGLVGGEPHAFTATASNSVGASAPTSAHRSWAYAAPSITAATATPVYREGSTDRGKGVVTLSITAPADARAFRVEETGETIDRTGRVTEAEIALPPGSQAVTLVPISQFQPPTGDAGNEGGAFRTTVTVAGAPYFDPASTQATAVSNTAVNVSGVVAQSNGSTQPLEIAYIAWRSGDASCRMTGNGRLSVSGAEVESSSPSLQGLEAYQRYNVKVCASNGFGMAESTTTGVFTFTSVDGPGGNTTYTVATSPTQNGGEYSYGLAAAPQIDVEEGFIAEYQLYGGWRTDFVLSADSSPGQVRARACHETQNGYCSDQVAITATTAPTIVNVSFAQCAPATASDAVVVSQAARGSYTAATAPVADDPTQVDVTVTWQGAFATLSPITHRMPLCP